MSELKRCPFCGGEVKLMFMNEESFVDFVWDEDVGNVPTWFKCYGCDSEFFHDEPIDTPEKQVKWWNTRKPVDDVLERLEKELRLSEENKEYARSNNPLQYERCDSYSSAIDNAIGFVKEVMGYD